MTANIRLAIIYIALVFCLPFNICLASIPDANVVKGQWEISAGAGTRDTYHQNGVMPEHNVALNWSSAAIDFGLDTNIGVGISYYNNDYLDELEYDKDFGGYIEDLYRLFGGIPPEYPLQIYDVHGRYQFFSEKDGAFFNTAVILGLMEINGYGNFEEMIYHVYPEVGFGISKKLIADWLMFRLNLVCGMPFGIEVGIKPIDNLEITFDCQNAFNVELIF